MDSKATAHWLAQAFPEQCPDGGSVAGTDEGALTRSVQGLVPGIEWPLWRNSSLPDETVFDVVEFAAQRIALPKEGRAHDFFRHHELSFDQAAGRRAFRKEVNQLLARGGVAFELTPQRQIERIGTPQVQDVLHTLRPATGDGRLDGLIDEALTRYRSRHESDRILGLEKLWDGFERLKTIEIPGGDKKASAAALLARIKTPAVRALVEEEMRALTIVGNEFMIRHHETGKPVVVGNFRDYLFGRMGGLIVLLLKETDRLA